MSVWVRLIGGLHDGEVVKVDDDQREAVRQKPMPIPAARLRSLATTTTQSSFTRYTRRSVSSPDGSVVYFALENLSDLEALQHALGP